MSVTIAKSNLKFEITKTKVLRMTLTDGGFQAGNLGDLMAIEAIAAARKAMRFVGIAKLEIAGDDIVAYYEPEGAAE